MKQNKIAQVAKKATAKSNSTKGTNPVPKGAIPAKKMGGSIKKGKC
jgi:hypothetical protein